MVNRKTILLILPVEGEKLQFEALHKTQRHPIVIVADFETFLQPVDIKKEYKTKAVEAYISISYCIVVITSEDVTVELQEKFDIPTLPIVNMGSAAEPEVARHFINTIVELSFKKEITGDERSYYYN